MGYGERYRDSVYLLAEVCMSPLGVLYQDQGLFVGVRVCVCSVCM